MEQKLMRKVLQVEGMTCTGCELRIENSLKRLKGVVEAKAIFSNSSVYVTYDTNVLELSQLIQAIERLDYEVKNKPGRSAPVSSNKTAPEKSNLSALHWLGIGIILFGLYVVIQNTVGFNFVPEINQTMGYGLLFLIGLLTSLHCIAMCGGINLSQCISYRAKNDDPGKFSSLKPSLLYNGGRVLSYTLIGGIVGALGSTIRFSGAAAGIVAMVTGLFMVIMGFNMLNVFPWLKKLNPRIPKFFGNKIHNNNGTYGPFYVGLLNGLMPCGPLQAMQIYALGSGSFAAGALSMFLFSIGTVPLMFGFGAVGSMLRGKFSQNMMKASAVLVIALGLIMANRGISLSGISIPHFPTFSANGAQNTRVASVQGEIQVVSSSLSSGRYEPITVEKGIPVQWTIRAEKGTINGCNNEMVVPEYGIRKSFALGDNRVEFTPTETGTFEYSCWMGMIRSEITVVDSIDALK